MSNDFLDVEGVNQRIRAFDKRHGDDCVFAKGWWIFSDGAMKENNPMGLLKEPPEDPHTLAKYVALYFKTKMEKAVKAFDGLKQQLAGMAQGNLAAAASSSGICNSPPPLDYALDDLKRLAAAAKKAKVDYDKATAAVERTTPSHLRQRDEQNSRNRASNESFLAQIQSIEV
jgi:hypothetical protein